MATPCIPNPYLRLAAYVYDKPEGRVLPEQGEYCKATIDRLLKNDPPFLRKLIDEFPEASVDSDLAKEAEGLLRCLWRGDYQQAFKPEPGPHTHFKGGKYLVFGRGLLLQGPKEEPAIVYSNEAGEVFIRPLREWVEIVKWPDGEYRPRFHPTK